MPQSQRQLEERQMRKERILSGALQVFKKNNISIRVFYAPNHTYDRNTFEALKAEGIYQVIDGYGLMPYKKNDIQFISTNMMTVVMSQHKRRMDFDHPPNH